MGEHHTETLSGDYLGHGIHRLRGWILCFAVFACPLVYSFHFTSFLHPKEMLLSACLVLMGICALVARACGSPADIGKAGAWLFIVPFAVPLLGLLSLIYPGATVFSLASQGYVKLFVFVLPLVFWASDLLADGMWQRRVWNAAIASGVIVALLALGQYFSLLEFMLPAFPGYDQRMYSVFGNQDLLGAYLAVILPMLLHRIMDTPRPIAIQAVLLLAMAILAMTLILSLSRSAWLAAAIGILLTLCWHRHQLNLKRHILPLLAGGTLLAALNMPIILSRTLTTFSEADVGGRARLWFWDGALRMFIDNPVFGVGLGHYPYWSPYYQGLALHAPGGEAHFHNTLHTDHAHNEYLEFITETGLIGMLIAGVFLVFLLRGRGVSWIPLISLAVCSGFTAVLHSAPHALLGFCFCAALFASRPIRMKALEKWEEVALILVDLGLIAVISATSIFYLSSFAQARAEGAHLSGASNTLQVYEETNSEWVYMVNHSYLESWGIAHLEAGNAEDAYYFFEKASGGLDTGRIHYLLGVAAQNSGQTEKAREHYEDALFRWPGDQQTFDALWSLTPEELRGPLRKHAARFKLTAP